MGIITNCYAQGAVVPQSVGTWLGFKSSCGLVAGEVPFTSWALPLSKTPNSYTARGAVLYGSPITHFTIFLL